MRLIKGGVLPLLLLSVSTAVLAEDAPATEPKPLPEPLTLEQAMSMADEPHPDLVVSEAQLDEAQALKRSVDADNDTTAILQGTLRYIDPPSFAPVQTHNDSEAALIVRKELYDFGRSEALSNAADSDVNSQRFLYVDAKKKRRLEIMRRFFDVLLADLQFYRYNEEMAVEYVELDRRRDRRELGQLSDYAVLEQESKYQRVRYLRYDSQNQQRQTRARLAQALNRPGQLPSTLTVPKLKVLDRKLPEVETLQKAAVENNARLNALRARVTAAEQRIAAAKGVDNATITGQLEAYDYAHQRNASDDNFRASVVLEVPLFAGDREDAAVAKARATAYRLRAQLHQAEYQVRQEVLETWLQLDALRVQREQMRALQDFRELNLDRSRALYEMEVKADLGDSMVQVTEAQYLAKQTDYKMALAWERMEDLTDYDFSQPVQQKDEQTQN
jgi:outer membrane protein TolC